MSNAAEIEAARARLAAKIAPPTAPPPPNDPNTPAREDGGKQRRNWHPTFLAAYADRGSVTEACRIAGIGRTTAYEARLRDPDFAGAWDAIEHDVVALLESSALERALGGDSRLTEFLLRANRPLKYGNSLKIDGKISVATEAELDDEIEQFLAREREAKEAAASVDDAVAPGQSPAPR